MRVQHERCGRTSQPCFHGTQVKFWARWRYRSSSAQQQISGVNTALCRDITLWSLILELHRFISLYHEHHCILRTIVVLSPSCNFRHNLTMCILQMFVHDGSALRRSSAHQLLTLRRIDVHQCQQLKADHAGLVDDQPSALQLPVGHRRV